MEVYVTKFIAVVSIVLMYFGSTKIDAILKDANVEVQVIKQVNKITLLLGAIITTLSGYILFFK